MGLRLKHMRRAKPVRISAASLRPADVALRQVGETVPVRRYERSADVMKRADKSFDLTGGRLAFSHIQKSNSSTFFKFLIS